jgi:hypothetical protein
LIRLLAGLLFPFLLHPLPAQAEYRAYRLIITNTNTGAQRTVLSNLDPIQYHDLYPVLKEEDITLDGSWKCFGDTSHKPVCPQPETSPQTLPKSDLK